MLDGESTVVDEEHEARRVLDYFSRATGEEIANASAYAFDSPAEVLYVSTGERFPYHSVLEAMIHLPDVNLDKYKEVFEYLYGFDVDRTLEEVAWVYDATIRSAMLMNLGSEDLDYTMPHLKAFVEEELDPRVDWRAKGTTRDTLRELQWIRDNVKSGSEACLEELDEIIQRVADIDAVERGTSRTTAGNSSAAPR